MVPNPKSDQWYEKDQLILAWINSTLSPEILAQVIDLPTAHDVWNSLNKTYSQQSEARLMQIRQEIQKKKEGWIYWP